MKAEYVNAWVAALRSGEYSQGHGQLKTACNEYCCLGVLADLAIKNNWFPTLNVEWRKTSKPNKQESYVLSVNDKQLYGSLHFPLIDELNLSNDFQDILVDMNDINYCSFDKIANYIETNLKDI